MVGLETHSRYDETYVMYLVVGHSSALRFDMTDNLASEITDDLWLYMGGLSAVLFFFFFLFACIFVCRLRFKLTKPIGDLAEQIKNPQQFLANRDIAAKVFAPPTSRRLSTTSRRASTITDFDAID